MANPVDKIIQNAYGPEIAERILTAYSEALNWYSLEKWKVSELDAGHFVEAVRRIIEFETTASYTPFDKNLPKFNDTILAHYASSTVGDDSFRTLIPRVLWAIYTVRNKRGVAHTGKVAPNEMDAALIVASMKWVLSEIVRIKSLLSIDETTALVSAIVERQFEILWKDMGVRRILDPDMPAKNQVLVLLYDKSPSTEEELRFAIEYKNKTDFRKNVLQPLHTRRRIEYRSTENTALILPPGILEAEKIIALKYSRK